LEDLDRALTRCDLVISAADTRGAILTRGRLARRLARGPLVLIDMAVPRSVDADARALPGLRYRSIDDLTAAPETGLEEALAEAERRCEDAAREFVAWRREREAAQAVRSLRERAERLREARLARALAKLRHLDARDRRVVVSLAHALTNELLHAPTLALRRAPERAEVALELFGVDE
jgi:glutamyl-tRNA reductase